MSHGPLTDVQRCDLPPATAMHSLDSVGKSHRLIKRAEYLKAKSVKFV